MSLCWVSWSTLSLKSSHDSSRLVYRRLSSSAGGAASGARSSRSGMASVLIWGQGSGYRPHGLPDTGFVSLAPEPPPFAEEPRVEHVAPRPDVGVEDLEPAVVRAVRRLAEEARVHVVPAVARGRPHGRHVLGAHPPQMAAHHRQELVAVVDLAQQVLEPARLLRRPLRRPTEHRLVHLQHIAQPLGRYAGVVERLLVGGIERLLAQLHQLAHAHGDDPPCVLVERLLRVERLALARLHGPAAPASAISRAWRSSSSIRSSASATTALAACCSERSARMSSPTPGRSSLASDTEIRSSSSMFTSRSRRSPSASASAFTSSSTGRCAFFGKHGSKISSAARSRLLATRMSCTRSMSDVSSTPSENENSSSVRVS